MSLSPDQGDFRLDRKPRPGEKPNLLELMSLEYYPAGAGISENGAQEMKGWTFRSLSELRELALSFAQTRGVTERGMAQLDSSQILAYMDIIANHGLDSAASGAFRLERESDAAFQAAADCADFVRREYLKFRKSQL